MREPAIIHKLALVALGAALLIPAGVAGIATGLDLLQRADSQPVDAINGLLVAIQALAPLCQPLICLLFGLTLLSTAILLLARGLQSAQS